MWKDVPTWVKTYCFYKGEKGNLKPIELTPLQEKVLSSLVDYKTVVLCVPKRQGKTMVAALAAIYCAFRGVNNSVLILSTSREHAETVVFRRVCEILRYSEPYLREWVAEGFQYSIPKGKPIFKISQTKVNIQEPINSVIETVPCTTEAVAGRVYTLLLIDELALISDEETVSVVMGQSERQEARILITSTASSTDHLLYRLYKSGVKDLGNGVVDDDAVDKQTLFIYRKGEDFYQSNEVNPLITPDFLERMRKQYLPHLFNQYFLNEFGAVSGDVVFTPQLIEPCLYDGKLPESRDDVFEMFPNAIRVRAGVGIDRALPFSQHGDQTAGTLLLKIINKDGSVVYLVREVVIFPTGRGDEILEWIGEKHQQWLLSLVTLEVYQTADIRDALERQGINTKLIHVNQQNKLEAFNFLYHLLAQGNIFIPTNQQELIQQLKKIHFRGGRFEALRGEHDDTVYSLVWILKEL